MTTVSWPSDLSGIRWSGYSRESGNQTTRFEVDDGGPAEQGRFTTAAVDTVSFVLRCTAAQVETLRAFYLGDAACGAVWFSFADPVSRAAGLARFVAKKPPKTTGQSRNKFDCSITLEFKG